MLQNSGDEFRFLHLSQLPFQYRQGLRQPAAAIMKEIAELDSESA
jgi:hypothetical protein